MILLTLSTLMAHDERLHKGNALTGEIVSVSADGLQLKTKTDTINVKFSSKQSSSTTRRQSIKLTRRLEIGRA